MHLSWMLILVYVGVVYFFCIEQEYAFIINRRVLCCNFLSTPKYAKYCILYGRVLKIVCFTDPTLNICILNKDAD